MSYCETLFCNYFPYIAKVQSLEILTFLFLRALQKRTNVNLKDVDYIIMGTVIQEVKTANIAREVNSNLFVNIKLFLFYWLLNCIKRQR